MRVDDERKNEDEEEGTAPSVEASDEALDEDEDEAEPESLLDDERAWE